MIKTIGNIAIQMTFFLVSLLLSQKFFGDSDFISFALFSTFNAIFFLLMPSREIIQSRKFGYYASVLAIILSAILFLANVKKSEEPINLINNDNFGLVVNEQEKIIGANDKALQILKYSRNELLNKQLEEIQVSENKFKDKNKNVIKIPVSDIKYQNNNKIFKDNTVKIIIEES